MTRRIAFLHTAQAHVRTFSALVDSLSPGLPVDHDVREALLVDARRLGCEDRGLQARVAAAVEAAFGNGARVVVCTCSTIGGVAERVPVGPGRKVLRIDRPMAEHAVDAGSPILLVAALESTLQPTAELLEEVASRRQAAVRIERLPLPEAWAHFEAGRLDDYCAVIAAAVRHRLPGPGAVVLAQASMRGAQALLADAPIPVLSSPEPGVRAALAALAALEAPTGPESPS